MLIKFLKHTGAARDGQPGDPDARLAIDYLQGEMVLKPERAGGPKVWTRRATAPIPIRRPAPAQIQHRHHRGQRPHTTLTPLKRPQRRQADPGRGCD